MSFRVGSGFDVHAFGDGNAVPLGGVQIPHSQGVVAHSDGDVLIHALCDAILGAMGKGDIGEHFPPGDARWRNATGQSLLETVIKQMNADGYALANADLTVIAEQPRLGPHKQAIRRNLSAWTGLQEQAINIKATTTEMLGFCGRGEGIAAMASVLIERLPPHD